MKAEDTLMTFKEQTEEMKTAKVKPGCLVRKQARISFKAGYEQGKTDTELRTGLGQDKPA